ncbi:hypothetical protein [Chryseobacterium jejuense]|uniref:Uncharacterized protein n=1 Tax=Chryseobacterium jejuense TaxID=445960 RepID=A0A2X2X6A1_CHRJE|nr:hypothetical protein [Chryseobacterium jejuense]SDJ55767.1 hypothetical protein SAMN05421542_3795 [Chryseobacterium jejuense]SQB46211.1 Uncharacterised protein [Chryseobacterium jejuense]
MLSIFILIGAYRYYARLAEKFGKVKWQLGLLAIGVYLGTQIVLGMSYGVYLASTDPNAANNMNYTGFSAANLVGWLISLLAVWGVYLLLEQKYSKENLKKPSIEIQKIGEASEDSQK